MGVVCKMPPSHVTESSVDQFFKKPNKVYKNRMRRRRELAGLRMSPKVGWVSGSQMDFQRSAYLPTSGKKGPL